MTLLRQKRILLGLGGGIAAYKGPELVRRLRDAGADVHVALTDAARHFVSPLALEVVSENPVHTSLWQTSYQSQIVHTDLAKEVDLVILAPATADLIGKIRHGLADDLLTTTIMAAKTPVLICPAMNTEMLTNPLVRENIDALAAMDRYHILEPGVGMLACGIEGPGRQPDPPEIIGAAHLALTPKTLTNLRALVSAGPTAEALDPIRYLTNRSTGTMGFALARALAARGAEVTLVAGPVHQPTPVGIRQRLDIRSAQELHDTLHTHFTDTDLVVMTAAVADLRPTTFHPNKIKKRSLMTEGGTLTLPLERTQDILHSLSIRPERANKFLCGFAAETDQVLAYAQAKLTEKDLDWIVANDVSKPNQGFGRGLNAGHLIEKSGTIHELGLSSKDDFADAIVDRLSLKLRPFLQTRIS